MEDFLSAAARFINTTSAHIFLTGKAGTGKTTFLRNLDKITHKSLIVVAPTGIAALNAGGVTIHSQFLLPPLTFLPDRHSDSLVDEVKFMNQNTLARKHPLNSARKQVLRSIDLLVIDEVSMLRADLLDAIDYRMRAARGNYKQSFGGAQVLFIGDLYQLPPVVKGEQWDVMNRYYRSPWFYEAKALQEETPVYIELDKIFRQTDSDFISILNNLRNDVATPEDIDALNQHYKTYEEISQLNEVITLTTHNYKADELNQKELRNLDNQSHFFAAHIEGEFPESMYPVQADLELKIGAQIMFVRNDTEGKAYFNGKLATVKEIYNDEIYVIMAETHTRYQLKRVRWENKKYKVDDASKELEVDNIGAFEQYPVRLAWAITVHKSQGLTFDRAIIDVGQAFADGQVYVALSRLRTLDGLILSSPINSRVISTDKQIVAFAKQNHRPDELNVVMKKRQQQFIRQLLENTFDFNPLVTALRNVRKESDAEVADDSMKPVLIQIADALDAEHINTLRFRRQLADLLDANDSVVLLERIKKGSAYYKSIIFQNLSLLLHHREVVSHGKRVKTYLDQLNDLDQQMSKTWEAVDKAAALTEGIIKGDEKFEFKDLAKLRADERSKLMSEIYKITESEEVPEKKKKPRKSKKANSDDKRTTFEITLDLLNSGMTVEQIAKERQLTPGTIESHLTKGVEAGTVSIFQFMTEEMVIEIVNSYRQLPADSSSKELYASLKGKFSYNQLRAAMVYSKLRD